ncbi:hypothetical protein ScPMuIL_002344 [Solemya velum]
MEFVQRPASWDESFECIDIFPNSPASKEYDEISAHTNQNVIESSDMHTTDSVIGQSSVCLDSEKIPVAKENVQRCTSHRSDPLTLERVSEFMDDDGRLVNEHALRKAVFLGGVEPSIRPEVWQFLFSLYPCDSTTREREELLLDYTVKYHEMKSRWKTLLVVNSKPGATPLEQGIIAKYQHHEGDNATVSPDFTTKDKTSTLDFGSLKINCMGTDKVHTELDFNVREYMSPHLTSPEIQQKTDFMKLQAQVYVNRQKIDIRQLLSCIRVIDKDVPRTDRDYEYFKGLNNPHLTELRDILITFAAFHPSLGYAQGMNDILARFLVVFRSEVLSYWCFERYLNIIQQDFMEDGMLRKIGQICMLLEEMDPVLYSHLDKCNMSDLIFCHRWLLLGFKREFSFDDSLHCFEILASHHLEFYSMEAEKARRLEQMREFENRDGVTRTASTGMTEYSFDLFMCLALLEDCREELLKCQDVAMVFTCINSLKIDLDPSIRKAEKLFYKYCERSVEDSFLLVDTPSPRSASRR